MLSWSFSWIQEWKVNILKSSNSCQYSDGSTTFFWDLITICMKFFCRKTCIRYNSLIPLGRNFKRICETQKNTGDIYILVPFSSIIVQVIILSLEPAIGFGFSFWAWLYCSFLYCILYSFPIRTYFVFLVYGVRLGLLPCCISISMYPLFSRSLITDF